MTPCETSPLITEIDTFADSVNSLAVNCISVVSLKVFKILSRAGVILSTSASPFM